MSRANLKDIKVDISAGAGTYRVALPTDCTRFRLHTDATITSIKTVHQDFGGTERTALVTPVSGLYEGPLGDNGLIDVLIGGAAFDYFILACES